VFHVLTELRGALAVFEKLAGKVSVKAAERREGRMVLFHAAKRRNSNDLCLVAFAP
jgi:hypothetical protein